MSLYGDVVEFVSFCMEHGHLRSHKYFMEMSNYIINNVKMLEQNSDNYPIRRYITHNSSVSELRYHIVLSTDLPKPDELPEMLEITYVYEDRISDGNYLFRLGSVRRV